MRPSRAGRLAVLAVALATATTGVAACGPAGRAGTAPPVRGQPAAPAPSSVPPAPPAESPSGTPPSPSRSPSGPSPLPRSPSPSRSPSAPGSPGPGSDLVRPGATGPDVLALQQRLTSLGYWLGTPDGRFGPATAHALTALQKVAGIGRDGVLGPETRRALERATRVRPHSTGGTLIEVDLSRQVVLLVRDGRTEWVLDASTGAVAGTTPTGRYKVFRQVDGYDPGPLGVLYRPKYFTGGVAVHGYPDVPPYPASHGCVRVTNEAMDWLWSTGRVPIGLPAWVY